MICCCSLAGTDACKNCQNKSNNCAGCGASADLPFNTIMTTINNWAPVAKYPVKYVKPTIQYWCPECNALLTPYQKYCQNCAAPLDWSDISDG